MSRGTSQPVAEDGNGSTSAEVGAIVDTGENPVREMSMQLKALPSVIVDMTRVDEPSTPDCIGVGPVWYSVGDLKELILRFERAIQMASAHRSIRGFTE